MSKDPVLVGDRLKVFEVAAMLIAALAVVVVVAAAH